MKQFAIATLGDTIGHCSFETFKVATQHEVCDTRDGISTIDRRSTTGDDFDALNQSNRRVGGGL